MVKCELEEVEFGLSVICKVLDFFQFVIKFVESDYGSYKFFVLFKFYVFCYMDDNRDDCIFFFFLDVFFEVNVYEYDNDKFFF